MNLSPAPRHCPEATRVRRRSVRSPRRENSIGEEGEGEEGEEVEVEVEGLNNNHYSKSCSPPRWVRNHQFIFNGLFFFLPI